MTKELRMTIEPSDIVAIELECVTCHGRQVIQINEWRGDNENCPNCNALWPKSHVFVFQNLFKLAGVLAETKRIKETKDMPFKVRLELAIDPLKDKP